MMVNMNGLSYGTWKNIQRAIEEFDVPLKSSGNYLLNSKKYILLGILVRYTFYPNWGEAHSETLPNIYGYLTNTVGKL